MPIIQLSVLSFDAYFNVSYKPQSKQVDVLMLVARVTLKRMHS